MKKHFLVLSLLAAVSTSASAEGVYVFGDIGQSKFSGDLSETDTAYAVGLGYKINPTFSFELGYHDLGGVSLSETIQDVDVKGSVDASAVQLSATAAFPLSDAFSVYGRLGYAKITLDAKATASYMGQSYTESASDSENKAVYGLGLGYKINEKVSLRAEYQKFGDTDISSITAGISYTF